MSIVEFILKGGVWITIALLIIVPLGSGATINFNEKGVLNKGYFKDNVFNNGRIKMLIYKNFSVICSTKTNNILVEKFYPIFEIKIGNQWKKINFNKTHMYENIQYGLHVVTIYMNYADKDFRIYVTLSYVQKHIFNKYQPLYPHLEIISNKTITYRVIWHLEGIKINHFEIINNKTNNGQKRIIYNKTIDKNITFRNNQDIMIGYFSGKKAFGLNWEKHKTKLNTLIFKKKNTSLNAFIVSKSETIQPMTVGDPPYPIPDTGSGGGGGGGNSQDSDGDGLTDEVETNGWGAWWYDSNGNYHHIIVTSDPNKKDTDGDGVSDYDEFVYSLNPQNKDTDGDKMSDFYEIHCGSWNGGWQEVHWYNERYAVLIARRTANDAGFDEFWNDLKIMYDILKNNYGYIDDNSPGFDPTTDHIAILYGSGEDVKSGKYGTPSGVTITDFSATKANIHTVFNILSNVMSDHDFLFVWTFDHGGYIDSNGNGHGDLGDHAILCVQDGYIKDSTFASNYVRLIQHYKRRVFVMQQCYSGGFINDLSDDKTVIVTACRGDEPAYEADTENEVVGGVTYHHGEFLYHFQSALNWVTPQGAPVNADSDGNGYISILEAFVYADSHDSMPESPQLDDDGNGLSQQNYDTDDGSFAGTTFL